MYLYNYYRFIIFICFSFFIYPHTNTSSVFVKNPHLTDVALLVHHAASRHGDRCNVDHIMNFKLFTIFSLKHISLQLYFLYIVCQGLLTAAL